MAPGARSRIGPPMLEIEIFRKQIYCVEESTCDFVGTLRRPHCSSAPGELCLPCPLVKYVAWASAEIIPGGSKVDILLIFFRLLAMKRKWTYTKKKMSSVTETVAYRVFLARKRYTEQMFVLVSMIF